METITKQCARYLATQEVELEGSERFSVITPRVASLAVVVRRCAFVLLVSPSLPVLPHFYLFLLCSQSILYDHLDDSLDSIDAAISFLKAELLAMEEGCMCVCVHIII